MKGDQVEPQSLLDRLQEVTLLDVRTHEEFDNGHIAGSLHIPIDELSERVGEIPTGAPVVAVCASGERSAEAADVLARSGLESESLEGGLKKWAEAGLPLDSEGGGESLMSPEMEALKEDFLAVTFAMHERFGDREPSDEESRSFLRDWLVEHKGVSPEEAQALVDEGS